MDAAYQRFEFAKYKVSVKKISSNTVESCVRGFVSKQNNNTVRYPFGIQLVRYIVWLSLV